MTSTDKMTKIIVDNESIKYVVKYKYSQNNKVIDLSDLDTSKCTNISNLFGEMTKLEEIRGFNSLNLSNVTDMSSLCCCCLALKELNLSGLDLHNVKDVSNICGNCDSLKELNLSGLDLHNVRDMSYMCISCHSLKELNLSGLDLSNVTNMSYMCYKCDSLKELDLSGLDLSNVENKYGMCECCDLLIDFKVDEQYHKCFKDIMDKALARRNSLSSINLNMLKIPLNEETMEELMNT